jgi:hypothetical protein
VQLTTDGDRVYPEGVGSAFNEDVDSDHVWSIEEIVALIG